MAQSETNERKSILLLCLLAAIHVFVFSAAFPFFNSIDEHAHFDLTLKYSHGHIPRGLEPISTEAAQFLVIYSTTEYLEPPTDYPDGRFPPPLWTQSIRQTDPRLMAALAAWHAEPDFEAAQPPLYYGLAGAWWDLGRAFGFKGGHLVYWLRFLNVFFVPALVWLGYVAARTVFPENPFLRIGVPALLAFFPQTAFYSIQNDVLSPLCFGAAFILLVKFLRVEIPDVAMGTAAGLTLAATFLAKLTNLPLLAVSAMVVLLKIWHLTQAGKFRLAAPAVLAMALCAGLPMIAWLAWCKHFFGDITGTAAKIQYLGWTHKPFAEWWSHPIFTLNGAWTFLSQLMATFWQGEFWWHRQPLGLPAVNAIYVITSICFTGFAVCALFSQRMTMTKSQRQALWFGLWNCAAAVFFLGFISIIYDFHDCFTPSPKFPYLTSGRMMLGVLIPFLLLYLYGLDHLLKSVKNKWVRPLILFCMVLFMLISEITTDWTVFSSQYNWFHM
jgi:hypothetical protein